MGNGKSRRGSRGDRSGSSAPGTTAGLRLERYSDSRSWLRSPGTTCSPFARDRDGDLDRERDVEEGVTQALARFPSLRLAGGTANESIEAWVLACLGDGRCEAYRDPKSRLASNHGIDSRAAKVAVVEDADLEAARTRSASLDRWVARLTVRTP